MKRALFVFSCLLFFSKSSYADDILVAVSSNMSHTVSDIAKAFHQRSNHRLKLSFGASGNLAHQIINGSPHQIFLSANLEYIKEIKRANKSLNAEKPYAIGKLSLFLPKNSQFYDSHSLESIYQHIAFGQYQKIAIANPLTAPYGEAALTALHNIGLWSIDPKKLVIAENISQATTFGLTSSVDMALISYSHCQLTNVKQKGNCLSLPDKLYQPIHQFMILTQKSTAASKLFFKFMQTHDAMNILKQHGYSLPINE